MQSVGEPIKTKQRAGIERATLAEHSGSVCALTERHPDAAFFAIPVLNLLTVLLSVILLAYYAFPEQIVFATRASAVALLSPIASALLPQKDKAWDLREPYFRYLSRHTCSSLIVSFILFVALAAWGTAMFGQIRQRYNYVSAINEAIDLVDAGQIAVPPAEKLAAAFSMMPRRPEVPFIIARSVRILSPDDKLGPFLNYMSKFNAAVDRAAVVRSAESDKDANRLTLDTEGNIPLIEPVQMLAQFMVEVPERDQSQHYIEAINLLKERLTAKPDDVALRVSFAILAETKATELDKPSFSDRLKILDQYIQQVGDAVSIALTRSDLYDRRFLVSGLYLEALDAIGDWNLQAALLVGSDANGVKEAEGGSKSCDSYVAEAKANFIRLLILRRRLMVSDDVLWWLVPAKLSLFHYFARQSGYPSGLADQVKLESAQRCPQAWQMLQELYSGAAFKVFQDPEQWANGTPLATSYNGAAAAAQLRKWLKLGW